MSSSHQPFNTRQLLKVFLCHTSADRPTVRTLYEQLRGEGVDPWLAEENLLAGQQWKSEIPKVLRDSDAVVVCLSRHAVGQSGYVQKEIRLAVEVAEEQPEGSIFVIPVRLEECSVPEHLGKLHCVNLFEERGYERLIEALHHRAKQLDRMIAPIPREIGMRNSTLEPLPMPSTDQSALRSTTVEPSPSLRDHRTSLTSISPENVKDIRSIGIIGAFHSSVSGLSFSPGKKRVLSWAINRGTATSVHIFDIEKNTTTHRRHWGVEGDISSMVFSYTDTLLFIGGSEVEMVGPQSPQTRVVRRNGRLLIWDYTKNSSKEFFEVLTRFTSVKNSADGKYIVVSDTVGNFHLHDVQADGHERSSIKIKAHKSSINDIAFSPNNNFIVSVSGNHNPLEQFHPGFIIYGVIKLLTQKDFSVKLWNIHSKDQIKELFAHSKPITKVAFSYSGDFLVAGASDGSIFIWQTSSWKLIYTRNPIKSSVNSIVFSPNDKILISGHENGKLIFWDTEKWQKQYELKAHEKGICEISISCDSQIISTCSKDNSIRLWGIASF